jgi:plastocyanin
MKSKPIGILFGVLALVAILAIAPHAFAAKAPVTISNGAAATKGTCTATNCFNPQVLNISPGDTVTWTNSDTVGHTATSGQPTDNVTGTVWDSSLIKAGSTYTTPASAFQNAGTYNYFCMVHPWMTGQIIVGAASSSGTTTGSTTSSGNMTGMSENMSSTSGNQAVPEFGPVATLVLVFAVVGVVIMSARTRGFLKL